MELLGVGAFEALLTLIVALIVVGPHRFPEVARQAGRYWRVARRFTRDVTQDFRDALADIEREVTEEGADLRSIRDIGTELEQDLREQRREIQSIGNDTGSALNAQPPPAERSRNGAREPAPEVEAPPSTERAAEQAQVVETREAAAEAESAAEPPAETPAEPPAETPATALPAQPRETAPRRSTGWASSAERRRQKRD